MPKIGKADLHIHTSYSYDGISTPSEVLEKASSEGLDVVAICDHDEVKGAFETEKLASKYGVDVIIGEEVLTSEGEVLGLFLKEKINAGKSLGDTITEIRKQGGLVVIPHPFSLFPMTRPPVNIKHLYELFREKNISPDAIETLNSMPVGKMSAKRSKRLNDKVFAVAEVAGSDAHIANHIGMSVTLFAGSTKEDLKQAILRKETEVAGDFVSRRESAEYLKKNILKLGKRAKDRVMVSYRKLKSSINSHLKEK